MFQAPTEVQEFKLGGSPSQRFNNLSLSSSSLAAYVDRNVVRVDEARENASQPSRILPVKGATIVMQARFVTLGAKEYLAVASDAGLSLFDAGAEQQLAAFSLDKLPSNEDGDACPTRRAHCCGVDGVQGTSFCAVGSSHGTIGIVYFDEDRNRLDLEQTLLGHRRAVCSLGTSMSHLVSGDESGQVIVWSNGSFEHLCQFPSMGLPCSAVHIRGDRVVAAFVCGVVRVYDVFRTSIQLEIDAHCRSLNAMDVHPFQDVFATVGEDGALNLWQLPDKRNNDVRLVSKDYSRDTLYVGVSFARDGSNAIATAAYGVKVVVVRSG